MEIATIKNKIYSLRNQPIILDRDLASLYQVKPIRLREQVKRNQGRFPNDFMFQLNDSEVDLMVSQNAIPSRKHLGGHLPYAFTEQGVASVSGILTSDVAIKINIQIIRAFVEMRKFILNNAIIFSRLEIIEQKQLKADKKFSELLSALDDKTLQPKQGIFYNGQIFDAYRFIRKIIQSAKSSIILIDNYVNVDTLHILSDHKPVVTCDIYTSRITKKLELDLSKYNEQHPSITIRQFDKSHDRFLIIDDQDLYHFGASLKDLGKKWFGFSKMSMHALDVIGKLKMAV